MSHLCAGAFFEIWNDSQKIINQDVEVGVAKPTIGRPTYKTHYNCRRRNVTILRMNRFLPLLAIVVSGVNSSAVVKLEVDTFESLTAGKTVFIKFFAPWVCLSDLASMILPSIVSFCFRETLLILLVVVFDSL
jgi:hypothetical protein